ncbi:hypothetical protein MMC30_008827 [Trapelia coarctata]|nr:hypothetical protein [Trapelia coarctata]
MEKFRRRSSADSGVSFLERALGGLSTQRVRHPSSPSIIEFSEPAEDFKGPLGLNLLHVPSEPLIDFIFVHGLGGGSRKTWSKSPNPYHYWPKEWLPRDPDFRHVRIHSFGYAATWGEKKNSILEINDFARSLLGEIRDDPEIRRDDTRIVLIGHSMGGLVIKKAYILARQDPAFQDLVPRFHSIYFLATPHRGSDLARVLTNILRVSWGQKPFVNDLEPNSSIISGINETFRHFAQDLQLWSFYETLQSNLIVYNAMVVDKSSATLGYAHERIALLNADHRGVCKFERPSDPNYKTIRNALSTTVDTIVNEAFRLRQEATRSDLHRLALLIGVTDLPEDDLLALEDARIAGSCEWLTSRPEFEEWSIPWSSSPSILWLNGNPATGKSVLASHVINHLEGHNHDCSYFFFKHGITTKSSISDCLRSLAYQMALSNVEVRRRLLQLEESGVTLEKNDEKAIWRKLFLGGVFQATFVQPQYWVIDALDECGKFQSLFPMISNIGSHMPVRIFLTSRKTQELQRSFGQLSPKATSLEVVVSDTLDDIKLFIATKIDRLSVGEGESSVKLQERILEKSGGSFLWVRLVMQELEHVWSEEGIEEVLNEIPADMNMLYTRTLENMSKVARAAKLAKAILTWVVCSSRLLTLREMQSALKLDINETVQSLEKSIASTCGQLVFVDQRSRVQMVHQTARDFLLQENLDSEFAVKKSQGHARLATKCLEFLASSDFRPPRTPMPKHGIKSVPATDRPLSDYASAYFSDHLYKASSFDSEPWDALYEFLGTNILSWMEHLARSGDLHYITHTATNLRAYLDRRAKYYPPIGQQVQTVEAWSVDMIRVSAKFRTSLLSSPASIHWLVPPMCPAESIIAQKFTSPHRGLTVKGSTVRKWDDCLSQINYHGSQATAVSCGSRFFAVGLSTGKVILYSCVSGQQHRILEHAERVKILRIGAQNKFLASSGLRYVRIWDINMGHQIWTFNMSHQALTLDFTGEDECLMAATQGDYLACWDLLDGSERARVQWHDGYEAANQKRQRPSPTHAVISPDRNLLAVSYRGCPILLFDIEAEMFFGECVRRNGSSTGSTMTHYPPVAMAFNPNRDFNLLIASYGDGELIIYDPWTLELKHRFPAVNAQTLACSPDGRTLVTGGSFGTLRIFDMDGVRDVGLTLIYRIDAYEEGIKSLVFSNDGLRFIDIRGSQCRVWEPAALVRGDSQDGDQSEISDPVPMVPTTVGMIESGLKVDITAIACHHGGEIVFCGKQDGSVTVFLTEDGLENGLLYKHVSNIAVTSLIWGQEQNILVSADESSRVIVRRIAKTHNGWSASEILADQRFGGSISGLLLNSSNDRLLVSGEESHDMWTVHGEKLGSKASKEHNSRYALCHPLQSDALILIGPTVARIAMWQDLKELTETDGIRLNRCYEPSVGSITSSVFYQSGSILAELLKGSGDQSTSRLECWNAGDFVATSASVEPLPGFEALGPRVEHIIAIIGTTFLYLDTDLWVCSLDIRTFAITSQVRRHFFIPSDWQSNSGAILFRVNSRNEFVFAKKHELMIIKRGLDYSEVITLSKVQEVASNPGSKLHLKIP